MYEEMFRMNDIIMTADNGHGTTKDDNDGSIEKTYNDIDVNINSTHICRMKLFAMIRKSKPERRSYKLSPMYKDMVGIDKLSSSENG